MDVFPRYILNSKLVIIKTCKKTSTNAHFSTKKNRKNASNLSIKCLDIAPSPKKLIPLQGGVPKKIDFFNGIFHEGGGAKVPKTRQGNFISGKYKIQIQIQNYCDWPMGAKGF